MSKLVQIGRNLSNLVFILFFSDDEEGDEEDDDEARYVLTRFFLCLVHYIFWRKTNFVFLFDFSDEEEDELEEASEDEAPPVVAKPAKKAMKKGKQKT